MVINQVYLAVLNVVNLMPYLWLSLVWLLLYQQMDSFLCFTSEVWFFTLKRGGVCCGCPYFLETYSIEGNKLTVRQ